MNLYVAIAGAAVVLASYAGTFYIGKDYGQAKCVEQQASNEQLATDAAEKTAQIAAKAISGIQVQHKTVNQEVIREFKTNVVYAKCEHPDVVFNAINRALTGSNAPPGGKLPASNSATGQNVRGNDATSDRLGIHIQGLPSVNRP